MEYARLRQWRAYHAPDNRPGRNGAVQAVAAGFPDLVLLRGVRLIFAELKADGKYPTPAQREWLDELRGVGEAVDGAVGRAQVVVVDDPDTPEPSVEAYVWRPKDWDEIERVLA